MRAEYVILGCYRRFRNRCGRFPFPRFCPLHENSLDVTLFGTDWIEAKLSVFQTTL